MPKYDIHCLDCNKEYEIEKSYSDKSPFVCPNGHTRIVKKISIFSVQYRGDGFTKKVSNE